MTTPAEKDLGKELVEGAFEFIGAALRYQDQLDAEARKRKQALRAARMKRFMRHPLRSTGRMLTFHTRKGSPA
jgi:hypothetical protein